MPPTCYARGPGITVRHARLHGMGRQFKRVISRVTRVPRNAAAPRRLARLTVPHRQPAGSSLTPRLLSILHPRSDPARVAVRARAPARDGDAGVHERRAGCVGARLETDDGRRRVHSRRAGRAHPRLHQAGRAAGEHTRAGGVCGARLQRHRQGRRGRGLRGDGRQRRRRRDGRGPVRGGARGGQAAGPPELGRRLGRRRGRHQANARDGHRRVARVSTRERAPETRRAPWSRRSRAR